MKKGALIQVFISICIAIAAGYFTGTHTTVAGVPIIRIYHLMGQLFLNALMCVVVPLVVTSLVSSVAQLSADGSLKTLGKRVFGYFLFTSSLAVLIGYFCVEVMQPGSTPGIASSFSINVDHLAETDSFSNLEQIVLRMVPANIFAAAAQGQILGLVLFSLVFGVFVAKIDDDYATVIIRFVKGIYKIMVHMTQFIMRALPFGVFGLVAEVVATTGADAMASALWFLIATLIAFTLYTFIAMPIFMKFFCNIHPFAHFQNMLPALITAFTTSSSAAALPSMMECMEKRGGVSKRICHLTLPLGSSLNLPGAALFICMAVFFLAQIYGVKLSIGMHAIVILLSLLTSFGMAGIPSASLVALILVLHMVGLPTQGMGLILAVERLLDMFRSAVNVYGNSCSTVLVASTISERNDDVVEVPA